MFVVLFHSVNQHVCCYLVPLSPLSMYQNSMKTLIWFLCQSGKQKSLKRSNTQTSPIFEKQFMYPSQNKDTLFTPSFSHFAPMGNSQNVQNFPPPSSWGATLVVLSREQHGSHSALFFHSRCSFFQFYGSEIPVPLSMSPSEIVMATLTPLNPESQMERLTQQMIGT